MSARQVLLKWRWDENCTNSLHVRIDDRCDQCAAWVDGPIAALSAAGYEIVPREPIERAHTAFSCVMEWIKNWDPPFVQEDEWDVDEKIAKQSLVDLSAALSAKENT